MIAFMRGHLDIAATGTSSCIRSLVRSLADLRQRDLLHQHLLFDAFLERRRAKRDRPTGMIL